MREDDLTENMESAESTSSAPSADGADMEATPEEREAAEIAAREAAEDEEFDAAVKAVVSSGLIAGPDPTVIQDVMNEETPDPTQQMADQYASDMEVDRIYRQILTRAPEHKVQPSLERVKLCLSLMGDPQNDFRAIHITGTNGKTSIARMTEAMLRERGLRTGRFTSPHLETVRERISIDGSAISREGFIQAWEDVAPFIEMVDAKSASEGGPRMSFFEVFTIMAYAAFAAAPIDVAVVEVGMGGLWDATNVIDADVAVLGPVALDHERWLGSTLEEIAHEKLGIVKPGSVFVCAQQEESVAQMAIDRAEEAHARLIMAGPELRVISRETAVGGQLISIQTPAARYEDIPLALRGDYQADNAVLAVAAVEAFFGGGALDGLVVEHALMAVSSPGRLEVVRSSPTVVVDAAHNPHGAAATARAMEEYYPGKRVGVIAMMADKDVEGYLGEVEPVLEEVVVTAMSGDRAMASEDLEAIARRVFGPDRVHREDDLLSAIDMAAGIAESDDEQPMVTPVVFVMGSIQLVGQTRTLMGKSAPDGA